MRDNPGIPDALIAACLETHYGLQVDSLVFLPIGHDLSAFVYKVITDDGASYFLKVRTGPVFESGLQVPRALIDCGISSVLAPVRTRASQLWCPLGGNDERTVVLYPFIDGENAKVAPMSDAQWRLFGDTLHAIHASGLEHRFGGQLREETFALPSAAVIRRLLALIDGTEFESTAAQRFVAFLRANVKRLNRMLTKTEALGRSLQSKTFDLVLCHGDIHGANILIGEDGLIWLVDWDSPLIAPRERDLFFVVGSRIGRPVEPKHEDCFFAGYGPMEIDPDALIYYRYERMIEDIGEIGLRVLFDADLGEQAREVEAGLIMNLFETKGSISEAETVVRSRWPSTLV
jgi:spectinomycin phosphotransferase